MTLVDVVNDPQKRSAIIDDGIVELEAEVSSLGGIKGTTMNGAYKAVKKLRPDFIESNLERLLPRFAPVLDPHYTNGKQAGNVTGHFVDNADEIAESMLGVTDQRAQESSNETAKKLYSKLRDRATPMVAGGMPRVGRVLETHGD